MSIEGKGFFIWKVRDCEGGDPSKIAAAAKASGFTHVLLKIADGQYAYNTDRKANIDLLPPVVDALRTAGITVWGWHYVYGYNPVAESAFAVKRTTELGLTATWSMPKSSTPRPAGSTPPELSWIACGKASPICRWL